MTATPRVIFAWSRSGTFFKKFTEVDAKSGIPRNALWLTFGLSVFWTMPNTSTITSVGIDIGTTTTQLVFSALTLRNVAGVTQVPRYAITDRAILYASPVVFTPKTPRPDQTDVPVPVTDAATEDILDERALADLIRSWYAAAGLRPETVTTGAVIVTGESLKTPNARRTVLDVADALGDFVVATAGPNLESVIAGRGSGAAELSRRNSSTVLNIDIGGGTSNYAVFRHGNIPLQIRFA